mmetsp:Transcript_63201/g.100338  ORF Transcript_63201/g.100338 Transcript_63201/m.100338 type:complete len:154 (+) Transcript_63201:86-547(+)
MYSNHPSGMTQLQQEAWQLYQLQLVEQQIQLHQLQSQLMLQQIHTSQTIQELQDFVNFALEVWVAEQIAEQRYFDHPDHPPAADADAAADAAADDAAAVSTASIRQPRARAREGATSIAGIWLGLGGSPSQDQGPRSFHLRGREPFFSEDLVG